MTSLLALCLFTIILFQSHYPKIKIHTDENFNWNWNWKRLHMWRIKVHGRCAWCLTLNYIKLIFFSCIHNFSYYDHNWDFNCTINMILWHYLHPWYWLKRNFYKYEIKLLAGITLRTDLLRLMSHTKLNQFYEKPLKK